ncbi:type IV secretion system DNA-binding domain-containing protein [Candidatus Gracilibacteria bacterium]|nr:type IV secretion system DNA-binding domain-containing protein [Candidatus Gracilibacteria bacterium]
METIASEAPNILFPLWMGIGLIGIALLVLFFPALFFLRYWHRKRAESKLVHLRITLPRNDSKLDKEQQTEKDFHEQIGKAQQFFRSLHETRDLNLWNIWIKRIPWKEPQISFELQFLNQELHFVIVCDPYYQKIIQKQVTSFYESAEIEILEPKERFELAPEKGYHTNGYYLHTEEKFWYPIQTYKQIEDDALNSIANAFSKLEENERGAIQLVLHPISDRWQHKAHAQGTQMFKGKKKAGRFHIPIVGSLLSMLFLPFRVLFRGYDPAQDGGGSNAPGASGGDHYVRMLQTDEETAKAIGEKANETGYKATLRVLASSQDPRRTQEILDGLFVAFNIFEGKGTNRFENRRIIPINKFNGPIMEHNFRYRLPAFLEQSSILNAEELATIYHFPDARYNKIPTIKWLKYKVLAPPIDLPNEGIVLGKSVYRGLEKSVHFKKADRSRHQYIIGKSGSGKSVLLWNQAIQDIKNGEGVCVIDPHGDLIEDVLQCVPRERAKDVIVFDPGDRERPMGLNLLDARTPEEQDRASLDAMEIFIKLFGNEIFGPRIQHYFRNGCLTLMADENEGATLIDIPRLFIDDDFQRYKVSKVRNPVVRAFWEHEMAQTGEREKQEMIPYFTSKFGPFVTNTTMRNIIGQTKSAFNLRESMDNGKIVLINLSKGKIGGINAQLLGLILVSKINMAAMSRTDIPASERRDFFLYVDEFQNFATDTFASILSEARKYRLNLIMAHQYIAQLSESAGGIAIGQKDTRIRDAVFGNVGTMVSFKVGAEDGEYLEKEYAPLLSQQDIINIANYKAYLKLNIDNTTSRVFSMATLYDPSLKNPKVGEIIKKYSRMKYGRKKEFVDAEIEARMGIDNLSVIQAAAAKDPTVSDDLLTDKPKIDSLDEARDKNEAQGAAVPDAVKKTVPSESMKREEKNI